MTVSLDNLKTVSALRTLSDEQLVTLARLMVCREYAPGEMIFLEGDDSSGIWFIYRGKVRIIKLSGAGRIQALCIASSGKCVGTCPLFNQQANPASAQALDAVSLFILPQDALQEVMQNDPAFVQTLWQIYAQRLAHLAKLGEGLGAWKVATRINDCLLAYATAAEPYPIVELTHEKLADLAGTVREVVSRHLLELESDGIIHLETGCIALLDTDSLKSTCLMNAAE